MCVCVYMCVWVCATCLESRREAERPRLEPATNWLQIRCPNHYATTPLLAAISNKDILCLCWNAGRQCRPTDRDEVSAADGAEDLVDRNARRDRAVEDVELSLESLWNVVASASRMNHGADHLYVHDVCELSRFLQVVETFHLHQLTCQLVRYLPQSILLVHSRVNLISLILPKTLQDVQ